MNPVEFHPFEMQFEVPGTDGQTVYTRRFQTPRRPDHLRLRLRSAIALPLCLPIWNFEHFMQRTTDLPLPTSLYR